MDPLLNRVSIFTGLDEPALELLSQRLDKTLFPAGTVILHEGQTGNRLFLIGTGSVRICKNLERPDEVELAVLEAGNFFGEMCILETLPRTASVQAVSDSVVFGLSAIAFYHLYETMPKQYGLLLLNISRDLSRRLRQLDAKFAALHG